MTETASAILEHPDWRESKPMFTKRPEASWFGSQHPLDSRLAHTCWAEGGALVFDPTGNSFGTVRGAQPQATGVFAYGGGADVPLLKHVALRAEYRGLVYSAPGLGLAALKTNAVTHTAQPSAGLVIRF